MSDSSRSESREKDGGKKRSAKFYILMSAGVIAVGLSVFLLVFMFSGDIDQSVYSIGYVVRAMPEEGCLNVDVSIDVSRLSRDRTVLLYKGMMNELTMDLVGCTDGSGNEVPFSDSPDLISIGPIDNDAGQVHFKYNVEIGSVNTDDGFDGLPLYAQGCLLDDLITFSGEYSVLVPFLDPDSFDEIGKYVKKASFEFIVPEGLQPIIPYQTPIDGPLSFSVDKPDWGFFNGISKSAFCFGKFEKFSNNDLWSNTAVYIDKAAVSELSQDSLDAMSGLLLYYSGIFGGPLRDVPIVLLRNSPDEGMVITAGVGSGGAAMSVNMRLADDFRVMSNMVFHAFFDGNIKPLNLRYKGYEWIYKGMAEYYVGSSIDALPGQVKEKFSIGQVIPMSEKYLRYLYFSLKEPGFLAIGPSDELSGMYIPQEEYYTGVKAPLIIDLINYTIQQKTGQTDGFLRELVKKGENSKSLDVEKFLKEVCGGDADLITDCLSGKALIPNARGFNIDDMSEANVLLLLDEDEKRFSSLFYRHNVFYPYMPMFLLNEEPFMSEVQKQGIHYNTEDIQSEVKRFSTVLHRLLLQRAMRASFAGIDDITLPNINRELMQNEVREKWSGFCQEIGYEYSIEEE